MSKLLCSMATVVTLAVNVAALGQVPWALDRIDQQRLPLDGQYECDGGSSADVYVVGSGIRQSHDEFGGRAQPFHDFEGGHGDDDVGLGTWVASVVGGLGCGVAKSATLYSVRITDRADGYFPSDLMDALDAIASNGEPSGVVLLAICGESSPSTDAAVLHLVDAGYTVVAPACCGLPFEVDGIIGVGGTDEVDDIVACSPAELFAPSARVIGAAHTSDNGTITLSSRSASAALTSGVAARIIADGRATSPAEVEQAIREATAALPSGEPLLQCTVAGCVGDVDGDGRLDFGDVLAILAAWGECEGCPADVDGNGIVDFADVLVVLSGWGECP